MRAEKLLSGHTPSDDNSAEAMLTDAQHLQTEFQVSVPEKQRLPVYHARRTHNKSRTGCLTCKKRRVKCDEQKPCCQRCQNRAIPCSYSSELRPSRRRVSMDGMSVCSGPNTILFSLSLENTIKSIEETLKLDSQWTPYASRNRGSTHSTSTVAFQHFINCSTETIAHPGIRNVMKTDMIRVSFTSAHLMYTILGVGMLHLNRISPSKERSYAEIFYWQHAIQLYQNTLSMAVRKESVDSLLSTCMLMGAMTVCPEHFKPTDSWVLTNRPEALNWLCLQSGLRCILSLAAPYIPDSIWAAAFKEIKKEEHQIHNQGMQQGREGLNADMADLCDIDDSTTESTNLYYSPLRILTTLLGLEKNCRNSAKCASFMGQLECDFLTLLRKRDPPALIILAHWMGLMCLLSQWQPWVEGRIRAECVAICMFLEHSTDPRILRLLRFPADSCGYELKDL